MAAPGSPARTKQQKELSILSPPSKSASAGIFRCGELIMYNGKVHVCGSASNQTQVDLYEVVGQQLNANFPPSKKYTLPFKDLTLVAADDDLVDKATPFVKKFIRRDKVVSKDAQNLAMDEEFKKVVEKWLKKKITLRNIQRIKKSLAKRKKVPVLEPAGPFDTGFQYDSMIHCDIRYDFPNSSEDEKVKVRNKVQSVFAKKVRKTKYIFDPRPYVKNGYELWAFDQDDKEQGEVVAHIERMFEKAVAGLNSTVVFNAALYTICSWGPAQSCLTHFPKRRNAAINP